MAGFDESGNLNGAPGFSEKGLLGARPTHKPTRINTGLLGLPGRPADSWVNIDKEKAKMDRRYNEQQKAQQKQKKGGCCFVSLFEKVYRNGEKELPVRRYRDEVLTARCKRGYYRLAEVYVPFAEKYRLLRWFAIATLVMPVILATRHYYNESKIGIVFVPVLKFWLKVWSLFGQDTEFRRSNGEIV